MTLKQLPKLIAMKAKIVLLKAHVNHKYIYIYKKYKNIFCGFFAQ